MDCLTPSHELKALFRMAVLWRLLALRAVGLRHGLTYLATVPLQAPQALVKRRNNPDGAGARDTSPTQEG
jgi:hypothetical protein